MDHDYWQKQSPDKPLFQDIAWSRPERSAQAGKLGIIGGSSSGFAAPAEAFQVASQKGIGSCRVLLPTSLQRIVGSVFIDGMYGPATKSGGFSREAVASMDELASWSDGLLFAGDLAHNSETTVAIESFLGHVSVPLTAVGDAVELLCAAQPTIIDRTDAMLAVTLTQLQHIVISSRFPTAVTSTMDLVPFVRLLHDFSSVHTATLFVTHDRSATRLIAKDGRVSSCKRSAEDVDTSIVAAATTLTVWWIQNQTQPFEAMTAALLHL